MPDPRVRRSRERLHQALVALILERGWDRVSVQSVCARSGVGRSTFYVHFADKEDLLIGGLEHVRDDLRAQRRTEAFGFVRGLVAHADASRRLFRAVIGKRSGLAVQRRFREIVGELMTEDLRAQRVAERDVAVTSRFLGGALVELLLAWVDAKELATAHEVEQRFLELAAPVVTAVRDSGSRVSRK
ncbi:MAG: TetR/AcrR family transcriptional regulator [Deltaproteobacteria bacterium]